MLSSERRVEAARPARCAMLCCAVQGLGSVRSLLKQHFPLVGGVWTLSLKAPAQNSISHALSCNAVSLSNVRARRLLLLAAAVPQGLDEVVIATIMLPVLEAIEYVHKNNGIHRDVKVRVWLCGSEGVARRPASSTAGGSSRPRWEVEHTRCFGCMAGSSQRAYMPAVLWRLHTCV